MELHRTENIVGRCGQLITVRYIGVAAHDGIVRNAVLNLKYREDRRVAKQLALVVVDALRELKLDSQFSVVTWAPTSSHRIRKRGFDQSELIARHVGAYLKVPVRRLLRRVSHQSQTGHSRRARLASVVFKGRLTNDRVLVVDDVITTGATLKSAAHELVLCGATSVICIAPSRTI